MNDSRLTARLFGLIVPLFITAPASGCLTLYSYRPVAVEVRDAESKAPIAAAQVEIFYPGADLNSPHAATGTTAGDGIIRLKATPNSSGVMIEAKAKGYLQDIINIPVKSVNDVEPAHLFEDVKLRPVTFVVELFTEPAPKIEFVVPNGFQGQFKLDMTISENAPLAPHQRCFTCVVPPAADVVQLSGPPLMRRAVDHAARYADGTLLPGKEIFLDPAKDAVNQSIIAFWFLKSETRYRYFFIGTRDQYEELRRRDNKGDSGDSPPSPSSSGQKRGRRNRGGSQSAEASN